MKTKLFILTLFMSGTVMLQSCDNDDDYEMSNQEFVAAASSSNNLEIAAGQLATTKGTRAEVQAFGSHMVQDHTATGQELASLASTKGWTLSTNLQTHHQNSLNMLSPLTGAAFDKAFAELMVNSHQEAVNLFREASRQDGVPDADLRAWAAAKLPALEHHLEEAVDLRAQVQ